MSWLLRVFTVIVLRSLSEQFAVSEDAQSALCRRSLHKASQLYNQSDAAAYGKLLHSDV